MADITTPLVPRPGGLLLDRDAGAHRLRPSLVASRGADRARLRARLRGQAHRRRHGDPKAVNQAFLNATAPCWACAQGRPAGQVLGLAMGRSVLVDRTLRHYSGHAVDGHRAAAGVAVVRLYERRALATIVFAAIFSIVVDTADGARSVPREYVEVARSVPLPPAAHADRHRDAGVAALLPRRPAARRGAPR